jgi:AcrR family transcriptional regulator
MRNKKDFSKEETAGVVKPRYGADTREKILAAARKVFARHPYHAASLRMIAAEGGFYQGLIRPHFPTKASLFEALCEDLASDFSEKNRKWMAEIGGLMPEEGLSLYLDRFIAYYKKNKENIGLIVQNINQEDEHNIPGYHNVTNFLSERNAIAESAAMLVFDKDSMARFQEGFTALILHFFGFAAPQARVLGFKTDSPEYLEWVKETILFIFVPVVEKALNKLIAGQITTELG